MAADKKTDFQQKIETIVRDVLKDKDCELFQCKVSGQGRQFTAEILVDKPTGGITMEECAGMNREVAGRIDEALGDDGNYQLSVCSPGCDWPLSEKKDFLRVTGREVEVTFAGPGQPAAKAAGRILGVSEDAVLLHGPQGEIRVPLNQIIKAHQTY